LTKHLLTCRWQCRRVSAWTPGTWNITTQTLDNITYD